MNNPKKKRLFYSRDFKINLLNYDQNISANKFLDSLSSYLFLPHILQPIRVRGNSKTLIDNIFLNAISPDIISGNLISSTLDHLSQFLLALNIFSTPQALRHMRETGLNLTKKTLPLTTFQLIGIRYYVLIIMTLIRHWKFFWTNLTYSYIYMHPIKTFKK